MIANNNAYDDCIDESRITLYANENKSSNIQYCDNVANTNKRIKNNYSDSIAKEIEPSTQLQLTHKQRLQTSLIWVKLSSNIWWPGKWLNNLSIDDCFQPAESDKIFQVILFTCNRVISLSYEDIEITYSFQVKIKPFQDIDESLQKTYNCAIKLASNEFPLILNENTNKVRIDQLQMVPESSAVNNKRSDVLQWDDYFMYIAFLSSMRSKDPSTQVGACIVNEDNRIVGIGYNGFPRGCSDDVLPWSRQAENELDTKYPYVCHAEVNCILNKNCYDVRNCKMYVALFPCNECSKVIIQSGLKEIVYLSDKYHDTVSMTASRRLLDLAKVTYKQHIPNKKEIFLQLNI